MFDYYDDDNVYEDEEQKEESKNMESKNSSKNFLGIMFNCCGAYGRIYKNKEGTAYVGRCPKCLRSIKIPVGEGGTSNRFLLPNNY